MLSYPAAVEQLIGQLTHLPGVGRKTAERYALYLLKQPGVTKQLAQSLSTINKDISLCRECFQLSIQPICSICSNVQRNHQLICVVTEPSMVLVFEQTGQYNGVYFVLGGTANQLDGVNTDRLRLPLLKQRITANNVQEIILGMNPDHTGEATAVIIREALHDVPIKISRLARGLPAGSDIEFADDVTLGEALSFRQSV